MTTTHYGPPERENPGALAGASGGISGNRRTTKLPLVVRWRNAVCAETSPLSPTQRLVALVLSLYADQDGGRCHPSEKLLAAAAGLSDRSVRAALAAIEHEGFASREKVKGTGQGWRWTMWTLCLPNGIDGRALPRRQGAETDSVPYPEGQETNSPSSAKGEERVSAPLGQGAEDNDSKVRNLVQKGPEGGSADLERAIRKSNLDRKAISRAASFDEFWTVYPKKVAKEDARRAWIRANLDQQAEEILEAVRRRAAGDPQWQDRQFIPHPATFLRGKRWTDEWKGRKRQPAANDQFRGTVYTSTPIEQMSPELRRRLEEAEREFGKEETHVD